MTALLRPTVLATDRSISPVTITRVSGRAISMITTTSSSRKPVFRVAANPSTLKAATSRKATRTSVITPSPVPRRRSREVTDGRWAGAWPAGVAGAGLVSSATEVPPSEATGQAHGERPVQDDGGEDQG